MFDEDTELLVVAHQRAADSPPVFHTGTAQFARRVGEVADTLRIALDIALFGGLPDAQHGLPPPRGDFKERATGCAVSFGFTHILLVSSGSCRDLQCG